MCLTNMIYIHSLSYYSMLTYVGQHKIFCMNASKVLILVCSTPYSKDVNMYYACTGCNICRMILTVIMHVNLLTGTI